MTWRQADRVNQAFHCGQADRVTGECVLRAWDMKKIHFSRRPGRPDEGEREQKHETRNKEMIDDANPAVKNPEEAKAGGETSREMKRSGG